MFISLQILLPSRIIGDMRYEKNKNGEVDRIAFDEEEVLQET